MKRLKLILLLALLCILPNYGCMGQKTGGRNLAIYAPIHGQTLNLGEDVLIQLSYRNKKRIPVSTTCIIGSDTIRSSETSLVRIPNTLNRTGKVSIMVRVDYKDGKFETSRVNVTMVPEKKPSDYTYEIKAVYPHDREAYTQGLLFDANGRLFESTGLYGKSTLREVDLKTGKVLRSKKLANILFGEGLALVGDSLFQLTWMEKVVIISNSETFDEISRFSSPYKEGWGLDYDGKNLIMSDGSSLIYFLDPKTFEEVDRIDVCDNEGPVSNLNELEFIDGAIYANIYGSDRIAIIDPSSGAVTGYVHCNKLLAKEDRTETTNVLNGIARRGDSGNILVTGKNWPKSFEISIIPMN